MNKHINIISACPLFEGIDSQSLESLLMCLSVRDKRYKKGDTILLCGERVDYVGLVISGSANISKEDYSGNTLIIAQAAAGEMFAEVFACAGIAHSPVSVTANENCEILFFNYKKIITMCSSACRFHSQLIENMLHLIAQKNLVLNQKIEIISKRTTREKLLCFFDFQRGVSRKFELPFNREQLAQYLCVDRSAMSAELGRMQREGIIAVNKNKVEIL